VEDYLAPASLALVSPTAEGGISTAGCAGKQFHGRVAVVFSARGLFAAAQ
jgi:hypothetical protein